nr:MAG TPA: hypothetical protein [Caudoviricetes sp.]
MKFLRSFFIFLVFQFLTTNLLKSYLGYFSVPQVFLKFLQKILCLMNYLNSNSFPE